MPTPAGNPRRRARGRAAVRAVGVLVAVGLGAVAVWLIVTGKTQKRVEVGVLIGLWGALLGAWSMLNRPRPAAVAAPVGQAASVGQELGLRAPAGVPERFEDAEERRRYELRLEEMLRRQIQSVLAAEIASLRAEVALLRGELVEKVGGQIRLERIETTRLIGSDIEALQQEIEQLKVARAPLDLGELIPRVAALVASTSDAPSVHTMVEQAVLPVPVPQVPVAQVPVSQVPVPPVPVQQPSQPVQSAPPPPVQPMQSAPPQPAWAVPAQPAQPAPTASRPSAPAPPVPPPPASPPPARAPEPVEAADLFASLPRLSRFTDAGLAPGLSPEQAPLTGTAPDVVDDEPLPGSNPISATSSGRHSSTDQPRTGGRRRRGSDEEDTLARILAREGIDQ